MKTKLTLALSLLALTLSTTVQAQDVKIGYTNYELILVYMDGLDIVEAELKSYGDQLRAQVESKTQNFQQKVQEYQQAAATMNPEVRQEKEEELTEMQQNLQTFQEDAEVSFARKRSELLQPKYEAIQEALYAVAEEKGYTHVINSQSGQDLILYYARPEDDLTLAVFEKLGIEPPTEEELDALDTADSPVGGQLGE